MIVQHEGGSITVQSCMSWEAVGEMTSIEGKTNSEDYKNILHDNLSMSNMKFGEEAKKWMNIPT